MQETIPLEQLPTPALLVDLEVLKRNAAHMQERSAALGVELRPHLKTAKCAQIAEIAVQGGVRKIVVSTVQEAYFFWRQGFTDITYAAGTTPQRFRDLAPLLHQGAELSLLIDSPAIAQEIVAEASHLGVRPAVLIELDCGMHRGGLMSDHPDFVATARLLSAAPSVTFAGIYTHAGHAYDQTGSDSLRRVAEQERADTVKAAQLLTELGLPCDVRSVGSTPTAMHAAHLEGISELHPGNYLFFDLFQVYLGACQIEDIAISILASVIGHRRDLNQLVLDCGQAALSALQPTGELAARFGCGLVAPIDDAENAWRFKIDRTETEHGMIVGGDHPLPFDALSIGHKLRVAPLSANATAALHTDLMMVQDGVVVDSWERIRGWYPPPLHMREGRSC